MQFYDVCGVVFLIRGPPLLSVLRLYEGASEFQIPLLQERLAAAVCKIGSQLTSILTRF